METEKNSGQEISYNLNQAMLGLNMDSTPQQIKPGTLTYALNAVVESFDGNMVTYQNEQSNILLREIKPGFKVIMVHPIPEQNRTILFLANPDTGESEIGEVSNTVDLNAIEEATNKGLVKNESYVNNGYSEPGTPSDVTEDITGAPKDDGDLITYKTIVNAACLGFDVNHPVHKAVHRIVQAKDDGQCGTELYWPQYNFPRRFINLDTPPFKEILDGCNRIPTDELDCSMLEVQPVIKLPVIETPRVLDGGSLTAGAYQFALQYANEKGESYTACFSVTNSVSIFKNVYTLDYNFETDNSIEVKVSNLDTRFRYFNLVVIKTINGATSVELEGTHEILKDSAEIVYSGNNKTAIKMDIDDVFQKYPYYREAEKVTAVDDTIVWAGLKGSKKISYQSIANNIQLKWETWQVPANKGYKDGAASSLYRTYMRDEVYGFEFVPLLTHGEQKEGAHIPARKAVASDLVPINTAVNYDAISTSADKCEPVVTELPTWKVYNTATVTEKHPDYLAAQDKKCYTGPYEYGEFAYWESERTYPCNTSVWGDLAGEKIRHHKFPDNIVSPIHDSNPNPRDTDYEHFIYPIGVRVDLENIRQAILNSDLPEEEKSKIIGFKIIRTDRSNNKSVVAKGLLYNMGAYTPYEEGMPVERDTTLYPNYPFNSLGEDPFLTSRAAVGDGDLFDFDSMDRLRDAVDNIQQQADTFASSLPLINAPIKYYPEPRGPFAEPFIWIAGTDVAALSRKLAAVRSNSMKFQRHLDSLENYYNSKALNQQGICSADVPSLTPNIQLYNNLFSAMDAVNSSSAIGIFGRVIQIIEQATFIDDHSKAMDIYELENRMQQFLALNDELQEMRTEATASYSTYMAALAELANVNCNETITITSSAYSNTRFTFHSPDTSFFQPTLGSILKLETVEGGSSFGNFVQVKDHAGHKLMSSASATIALVAGIAVGALWFLEPKAHQVTGLTFGYTLYYPDFPSVGTIAEKALIWNKEFKTLIQNLIPYKNYAYQYNSVGIYSRSAPVPNNGFKQRALDKAFYLTPGLHTLGDKYPINNWNRESSVYLKTSSDNPLQLPNSPALMTGLPEDNSRPAYSPNKRIERNVLSYYGSIKRNAPDQYGDMFSYNTVDTGYTGIIDLTEDYTGKTQTVFGGDVFINRFGLKRKLSYFLDTAVGRPDGADIDYSNLSNVGRVKFWYNTSYNKTPKSGFKGLMKSILGVPQSNLDGNSNKLFYQNGRIYLYSYGVAYFFTESEVNVDMRQAANSRDKDFYPNVGNGIPNDWLQESNVPIVHDNYYIYNKTYSKQSKENYFSHLPLTFDPAADCRSSDDMPYRAIYSDQNKWRIYKPISYFDFPASYGKLTGLDTINNSQVLVRFENKSFVYNAMTAIQTSSGKQAYLGNDDVFKSKPIDFGDTSTGYAGSQHSFLLKTKAGHLFIDAARGDIFLIAGTTPTPISAKGLSKWLGRNLPFRISRYFTDVNIDNAFNGVGITGTWDNDHKRFIITKIDYEPKPEVAGDITHVNGKYFLGEQEITLQNTEYFINRSWTLSYSMATGSWVSFHSYLPNYYISLPRYFVSGDNGYGEKSAGLWGHGLVHTSYQNFYGKMEPYVLEYPFAYKYHDEIIQNVQDYTTILEYYNSEEFYEINDGVYFNRAVLYNNQQCSGVLNLIPKPKGDMSAIYRYPKYNSDSKDILYSKSGNLFNYNSFWDVVKNPNNHNPIWIESSINKSVDRELNNEQFDYSQRSFQKAKLRAKELRIRHINDKYGRYKMISRFVNAPTQISHK